MLFYYIIEENNYYLILKLVKNIKILLNTLLYRIINSKKVNKVPKGGQSCQ